MALKIGVDLVDVDHFRRSIERTKSLKSRLFTRHELDYCSKLGIEHLASRMAAKEALFKACSLGRLNWKDIEVRNLRSGEPIIKLGDKIKKISKIKSVKVSISQTDKTAIAFVIINS